MYSAMCSFIINSLHNQSAGEITDKSVNTWRSYGQEYGELFY